MTNNDTIAAIATPPGRGGIGIIRISGTDLKPLAREILGKLPDPRHAGLFSFLDQNSQIIDQGIALYFPSPHSYTGEEVLELQGHGGPAVMNLLLDRCLQLGAAWRNRANLRCVPFSTINSISHKPKVSQI